MRSACLASFAAMGHAFELYVYEPVIVPNGITLRDANEIIPFREVFYFQNPVTGRPDLGPFSDLFRFKLLSERGGWWSDVDAICLSPNIPPVDRAWAQENPDLSPAAVGTSQIAFARNDPVVLELYRRCLQISKTPFTSRQALGPFLISDTLNELGLPRNEFGTTATFYPVKWIEMFKLWLPEFRGEMLKRAADAYFMPIYASFPQYMGLEFGRLPPEGSFLSDICYRYVEENRTTRRYTDREVLDAVREYFYRNRTAGLFELITVSGIEALRRLGLGTGLIPLWAIMRPRLVSPPLAARGEP
jgi:hypothetical protein